jgi:hypothetical protein
LFVVHHIEHTGIACSSGIINSKYVPAKREVPVAAIVAAIIYQRILQDVIIPMLQTLCHLLNVSS